MPQLVFDADIIETNGGWFKAFQQTVFVRMSIPGEGLGEDVSSDLQILESEIVIGWWLFCKIRVEQLLRPTDSSSSPFLGEILPMLVV